MIGKGKFFDLISRTVEDTNNPEITIESMLLNYKNNEKKYKEKQEDLEETR